MAELVLDDVAIDTVVEQLTGELVAMLCVVTTLVHDDEAVDTAGIANR